MFRFGITHHPAVMLLTLLISGLAAVATRMHAREVEAYREKNPDASPNEIERAVREAGITKTLERRFEMRKGQTYKGEFMRIPLYWYRDQLGRARYTMTPNDPITVHRLREWCKAPPMTFMEPLL